MLLEYNIYDNFNPNTMRYDTIEPSPGAHFPRGYPAPKARGVILDYELFQTGYEFTSTGVLTTEAKVGDVIEILTTQDNSLAQTPDKTISQKLSLWYVITTIDDDNKVVLQNYFWYMIEGSSYPTANIYGYAGTFWTILTGSLYPQLMLWGSNANWEETNLELKFNMEADTVEAKELATSLFSKIQLQPVTYSYDLFNLKSPGIVVGLLTNEWTQQRKKFRLDELQNPALEKIVITERSQFNFINVFVKDSSTQQYPSKSKGYTLDDNDNLVALNTYQGDGHDLPEQRTVKTMFYDKEPTDAQIKSEIMPSTTVSKIYFNQIKLYPIQVNDLVEIWYKGIVYRGYIADRNFTPNGERLTFVEGERG